MIMQAIQVPSFHAEIFIYFSFVVDLMMYWSSKLILPRFILLVKRFFMIIL